MAGLFFYCERRLRSSIKQDRVIVLFGERSLLAMVRSPDGNMREGRYWAARVNVGIHCANLPLVWIDFSFVSTVDVVAISMKLQKIKCKN